MEEGRCFPPYRRTERGAKVGHPAFGFLIEVVEDPS